MLDRKKEIGAMHWSRMMTKLRAKGMTQDNAYKWLEQRFVVKEEE